MSLANKAPQEKKYTLGIIVSRSFDNPDFLPEALKDSVTKIGHVYSNGALPGHKMVEDFCLNNGISYTVLPASATKHTFVVISEIIEKSDGVYILADLHSKSAVFAENECRKSGKKYRVFIHDSTLELKNKIQKLQNLFKKAKSAIAEAKLTGNEMLPEIGNLISDAEEILND